MCARFRMLDKSVRQIRFSFDPLVPGQGADEAAQLHPGLRSRVVAENTLVVFYAILDSTPGYREYWASSCSGGGTAGRTVLDSVLDPAEVKVLSTRCGFVFCNLQIPRPSILFESNRRHQIISPALALRCKYPPRRGAFSYEHITIERGISVQWGRGAARPSKFARTSDGGNCDLPRLRDKNCLCNS